MNMTHSTLEQNLTIGFDQPDGSQPRWQMTDSILPLQRRSGEIHNLLFVDRSVADYQQLLAGVTADTEVYVLDPTQDAIAQITQTLLGQQGIASLQILSHGAAGSLQLGNGSLNLANLPTYAQQIQSWHQALAEGADILLYGCNVAEGELGQAFVNILSQLTGADVAASDDLTGNTSQAGDWVLEYQTGQIETAAAIATNTLAHYQSILAVSAGVAGNNYTASSTSSPTNLNLVAGTSGVVNTAMTGDAPAPVAINLGSNTFRFYGQNYTGNNQLYVSVNGALTFGSPNDIGTNDNLAGNSSFSQAAIAPAWDAWVNSAGAILYQFQDLNADTVPDQLVVAWENLRYINSSTAPAARVTFQTALQLNTGTQDGNILFNYGDLSSPGDAWDEASSATVGIKAPSASGIAPLLVSFNTNTSPLVGTGRAIFISNRTPMLDLNGDQTQAASGINYTTGFIPGSGAIAIVDSTNLSLVDPNSATLSAATVQITNLLNGTSENLAATTAGTSIIASYNPATGLLSLTGVDTVANYRQVLRSVTYNNNAATPSPTNRVIQFSVSDGTNSSPIATSTVTFNSPIIDLNGAAAGRDYVAYFPGSAVSVGDSNNLTIRDTDSSNLSSVTVQITNVLDGANEVLAATTTGTTINATYNATTGTLSLTGSDTLAHYQQVLRTVTYNNTAVTPNSTSRVIQVSANDGTNTSPIATSTINLNIPILDLNGAATGRDYLAYFPGGAAVSVGDRNALTVRDPDSANLSFATVTLTNRLDGTAELLAATTTGTNITATYNPTAGILSLTGADTLAMYQQVLRSVTYNNTAVSPTTTDRVITWVANDGTNNSFAATATVRYGNPPNTPPVLTLPQGNLSYGEGNPPLLIATGATLVDPDLTSYNGGVLTISTTSVGNTTDDVLSISGSSFAVTTGNLVYNNQIIGTVIGGNNGTPLTITFTSPTVTPSLAQQVLGAVAYSNPRTVSNLGQRTLSVTINDGAGGVTNPVTRKLDVITPVAPIITLPRTILVTHEGKPAIAIADTVTVTDNDSTTFVGGSLIVRAIGDAPFDGVLQILNQGTAIGQISLSGNEVRYGNQVIGTMTNGPSPIGTGVQLTISLGANSNAAAIQALLKAITYNDGTTVINPGDRTVVILLNDGQGNTSAPATRRISVLPALRTNGVDFNDDGVADYLWHNDRTGANQISLSRELNGFSTVNLPNQVGDWQILATNDFDGDGDEDILWRNTSNGNVTAWIMNGATRVGEASLGRAYGWNYAGIGDFNHDGVADVAWTSQQGVVQLWTINRSKTSLVVRGVRLGKLASGWAIAGVGDMDDDGDADLILRSNRGGTQEWMINSSNFSVSTITLSNRDARLWSIAGVGDVDFDGDADILWTRKTPVTSGPTTKQVFIETYQKGIATNMQFIREVTTGWQVRGFGSYDGEGHPNIVWRIDGESVTSVWVLNTRLAYSRSTSLPTQADDWSLHVTNPLPEATVTL